MKDKIITFYMTVPEEVARNFDEAMFKSIFWNEYKDAIWKKFNEESQISTSKPKGIFHASRQ